MNAHVVPHVEMELTAHRPWYLPGDVVRVRVLIHTEGGLGRPVNLFEHVQPTTSPSSSPSRDDDVRLVGCSSAVRGLMWWDARRWSPPIGEFGQPCAIRDAVFGDAPMSERTALRVLFRSPDWALMSGNTPQTLHHGCMCYDIAFGLPTCLPSSVEGRSARLRYEFGVACALDVPSSTSPGRERCTRMAMLPLVIYSPDSGVVPLLLSSIFSPQKKWMMVEEEGWPCEIASLTKMPSPSITPPLCDELLPRMVRQPSNAKIRQRMMRARLQRSADVRTPLSFQIPLLGRECMTVDVESTTVMMSSVVHGCLRMPAPPPESAEDASKEAVVVAVVATLQLLECCPTSLLREGQHASPVEGQPTLVALCTHDVEQQELRVLNALTLPFGFVCRAPTWRGEVGAPTTLTDTISTLWQLQLTFHWCTRKALLASMEGKSRELDFSSPSPTLMVPLTVVPPSPSA